jgi:GDPmannose 4,6-dehydratase
VALENELNRITRLLHIRDKLHLHAASLESYPSIFKIINTILPDEIYHLAAQSYVSYSFEDEFSTLQTNINGTHFILSSAKEVSDKIKVYFAGSSEMFGKVKDTPQNEDTPFHPRSAYGISKVAGFELTRNYREAYDIFSCSGILFNHESERRGFEFVTRKISSSVARIKFGLQKKLVLGNINAKRDWGHAKDYVYAMWLMLQQDKPKDYVIGTGKTYTVENFVKTAFEHVGLNYKDYLEIDKNLYRPSEVELLIADSTKAKKDLGWQSKINFDQLVKMMVDSDVKMIKEKN